MDETIFHKIARGEVPCHRIWEDDKHLAFLSIYPNTEGVTVVIPKHFAPSYFAQCDDQALKDLIIAAKKVAKILDSAFPDVMRTALVLEGYGVNYLHVKLYPLHGTKRTGPWQPIESQIDTYFETYPGYVSSNDAKQADDAALAALAKKIREHVSQRHPI